MIITKETDYALRILRVLLDGEKHSVAEMSETELIPNQFAYQILRKLSAGNLVRVSRGALGGSELSCDLDATSLYDLMGVVGERGILCACMEPGYECRWQDKHGRCAIHCQLAALQQKQDEAFRAVSAADSVRDDINDFRFHPADKFAVFQQKGDKLVNVNPFLIEKLVLGVK